MLSSIRHLIVLLITLTFIATAIAQDKQKQEPNEEILKLDTNLVSIDVNVTSKSGSTSPGNLKFEDFIIYEDGVRQKLENFATIDVPFNIVLLLDTSGSAKDEIELMKKGLCSPLKSAYNAPELQNIPYIP